MRPSHDTGAENNSDSFCNISGIHGFQELFWPTKRPVQSLRFGSTLLLSGPPGAGKTTFALATVRAMMAHARREFAKHNSKTIAYYISSEVDAERLKANFTGFSWFDGGSDAWVSGNKESGEYAGETFRFQIDNPRPDVTNFYCITSMFEVDRPVPSPEELVNGIFNRIIHTLVPSEAPLEGAKIYVIVDSITALLKGCEHPGEERRQTHEIMRRLQDRFGKECLALIMLLAEQDHRPDEQGAAANCYVPTAPSVEDYLADIVFRLYVRSLPLGRRARILEVVKSQGANMALGEHSWRIISADNYKAILRDPDFQDEIREKCSEFLEGLHKAKGADGGPHAAQGGDRGDRGAAERQPGKSGQQDKWGGVIIFPRARLLTFEKPYDDDKPPPGREDGDADQRLKPDTGTENLDLDVSSGKVTMIAGPMGCGKSTLCRQFLRASSDPGGSGAVLITFEIPSDDETAAKRGAETEPKKHFKILHFTQSQFDLNALIAHINWVLGQGCNRLAFDGLSEWITTFDKPEAARVLEVLMATVKRPTVPPSVFMTYEMPLDDDPLGPANLGADADNLVVVRKVPINDELRRVIYVLKRDSRQFPVGEEVTPTHQHPAELKWVRSNGEDKLKVDLESLQAFTGLLSRSREVRPARVLIQLFAENKAEQEFNTAIEKYLNSQFKQRVDLTFTGFSLSEIGTTLETAFGAGKPSEAFNLAILSVDEWWLKARQTTRFLRPLESRTPAGEPDYRDFWWFEVEKGLTLGKDSKKVAWHAVPGYLDFAVFCINPAAFDETSYKDLGFTKSPKWDAPLSKHRKLWMELLAKVPRLWARQSDSDDGNWFLLDLDSETSNRSIVEFALVATGQSDRGNLERKAVFSFDSSTRETCSCMFFELAWAFGATESFLADQDKSKQPDPAETALLFLQFLVAEGLMPARSSIQSRNHNNQPILLSRHWHSTVQKYREGAEQIGRRSDEVSGTFPGELIALPFMPTGQSKRSELIESLLDDLAVRQDRWLERADCFYKHNCDSQGKALPKKPAELQSIRAELKSEQSWTEKLKAALNAYTLSRKWLLDLAEAAPLRTAKDGSNAQNWTADLDDLIELAGWSALRLRLFFGDSEGQFPAQINKHSDSEVAKALYEAKWVRHSLPDLSHLDEIECNAEHVVATGYVCSGSWMFGVDEKSRSSEIQAQILATLTSLDTAEKRAVSGAGIPARKDYFYLMGEKPVVGMEYLQCREFLRYSGSRARRRDRVLLKNDPANEGGEKQPSDPTDLYRTIHHEILGCLRNADLWRQQYATGEAVRRTEAIKAMRDRARQAMDAIYGAAKRCVGRK